MEINENGERLVEHHTKYKEIHDADETVWMTMSEHKKLHYRLRREGKCNIPTDELHIISSAAHFRTDKSKERTKKYEKNNRYTIDFYHRMMNNISHHMSCTQRFRPDNGKKIYYIDIN